MLTPKKTISFINKKTEFLTQNNIHFCTTVAFKQGNFGGTAILTQPCTEPYTKNWQTITQQVGISHLDPKFYKTLEAQHCFKVVIRTGI